MEQAMGQAMSFNCEMVTAPIAVTTAGCVGTVSMMDRRICTIPVITNSEHIISGTELLLEVTEPTKKEKAAPHLTGPDLGNPSAKRQRIALNAD